MTNESSSGNGVRILLYWLVVGIPLAWGVFKTIQKLPALFN